MKGIARDNLSGVADISVEFRDIIGRRVVRQAICPRCSQTRAFWRVPTEGIPQGVWAVKAVVTDLADNEAGPTPSMRIIIT